MKSVIKSMIIAFETYSRIPMPRVNWDDKSMKWIVCFFPLVGCVIGFAELAWIHIAVKYTVPVLLKAAIACVIPFFITGGIHMDGFADTTDALSSYQPRERKLEILKDSNSGAFAIIYCCIYFVLYFAAWSNISSFRQTLAVALGFVVSRAASGFALAKFKSARENGMLKSFADAAKKNTVEAVMLIYFVCCSIVAVWVCGIYGTATVLMLLLSFAYYRYKAYKEFGGTTGDLAGWFLQIAELTIVLAVSFLGVFIG